MLFLRTEQAKQAMMCSDEKHHKHRCLPVKFVFSHCGEINRRNSSEKIYSEFATNWQRWGYLPAYTLIRLKNLELIRQRSV